MLGVQFRRCQHGAKCFVRCPGCPGPLKQMPLVSAINKLTDAGHVVTAAEGIVPGLYDVAGIGRDLTIRQVIDVASRLTN